MMKKAGGRLPAPGFLEIVSLSPRGAGREPPERPGYCSKLPDWTSPRYERNWIRIDAKLPDHPLVMQLDDLVNSAGILAPRRRGLHFI